MKTKRNDVNKYKFQGEKIFIYKHYIKLCCLQQYTKNIITTGKKMVATETLMVIKQLNRRVVAIPPANIGISGSVVAGYLLSQIFYWSETKGFEEFFKTDAEFCDELLIGLYELKGAKKKLKDLGLVSIVRKGIPAKTYYKLDLEVYSKLITSYGKTTQLVVGKPHNRIVENHITNTESTTETTTYNKNNAGEGKQNKPKKKPKVSLEELSTDHIKDWLAEKRISGVYIHHDENLILEKFKNYCSYKTGKPYENFVAAYRNAFEWDSNNPRQSNSKQNQGNYDTAIEQGLVGTLKGQGGLTDLLT